MAGLQPGGDLQGIAFLARHLPGRAPQLQAGGAVKTDDVVAPARQVPAIIQRHRPVVSLICRAARDQGQNPDRRRAMLRQDARLFVSQKRGGQRTAGTRQFNGQPQGRGAKAAQPARGFHPLTGGAEVRSVHRGVPALRQHPLYILSCHRPGTFLLQGGQHNQHPTLKR
ncbi:hypothetical protein ACWKXN_19640 [Enterobacter sp. UPMP2060]